MKRIEHANIKGTIWISLFLSIIVGLMLIKHASNYINMIKLLILHTIIFTAAIIDYKKKIIPNNLVLFGFGIRLIIYIIEFIVLSKEFKTIVFNDLCGFGLGFILLAIISIATKGALGAGDVKLFGLIGILSGFYCTYATLFISMLLAAIISILLLLTKKKSRKDTIPFGPCIYFGYLISILFTLY